MTPPGERPGSVGARGKGSQHDGLAASPQPSAWAAQQDGGYAVVGTNVYTDREITFLSLRTEDGRTELVETIPNHPFYVLRQADDATQPKPEGHEELNQNWVGASDLREGDVLKRADDRSGVVLKVATVRLNQPMYNLSLAQAHTYYVGEGQWLVHNSCPIRSNPASYYSYTELKSLIRQMALDAGDYFEALHLLPKQFASRLGLSEDNIISVMLTPGNHRNSGGNWHKHRGLAQ